MTMVKPDATSSRGRHELDPNRQEWLVTNGLGGFASSTLAMTPARRYHGLLIAAEGDSRTVVLNRLDETILHDGDETELSGAAAADVDVDFNLELGLPVWMVRKGAFIVQRRIFMEHGANAVHVRYTVVEGLGGVTLRLRPWFQVRPLEDDVSDEAKPLPVLDAPQDACVLRVGSSTLTLRAHGAATSFVHEPSTTTQQYPMEAARGYVSTGALWSPGWLDVALHLDDVASFDAAFSTVPASPSPGDGHNFERRRRTVLLAKTSHVPSDLVLAADQFLVARRTSDATEVRAADGVIAGYHWFGRWGRDTMISLDGLAMHTRRSQEAAAILRETLRHVRRGLIPNLFPEHGQPLYHTADATLWLFHALHRLHRATGDTAFIVELLPALRDIVSWHLRGTDFNIGIDAADGLLTQGASDLPLTWMDAKVDDWVVTPRRGKAVELQGLWYNALHLLSGWERECGDDDRAEDLAQHARRTYESFNRRFWNARDAQLFDVVDGDDGDDASCRPNQLLALSLEHPVLDASRWEAVLAAVEAELVTPPGLRTLSPRDPRYQARYDGDRRSRDAAYHQGTVWPWLVGPYADACRRTRGDAPAARRIAEELLSRHDRACAGQIAEIHDAEPPYAPRGCVAQAWSVAEVIRCLAEGPPPLDE